MINYKGKKGSYKPKFSLEMRKEFGRCTQEVSKILQWKIGGILNKIISAICKNNFLTLLQSRYILILFLFCISFICSYVYSFK